MGLYRTLSWGASGVLKLPSTPSWLILVRSSHSSTTTFTLATPPSPSTIQNDLTRCVSPLTRDLGPISRPNLTSEARSPFISPSPFQGCGWFIFVWWRIWGGRTTRGTQEVGGPQGASWKQTTTFVVVHFSTASGNNDDCCSTSSNDDGNSSNSNKDDDCSSSRSNDHDNCSSGSSDDNDKQEPDDEDQSQMTKTRAWQWGSEPNDEDQSPITRTDESPMMKTSAQWWEQMRAPQ